MSFQIRNSAFSLTPELIGALVEAARPIRDRLIVALLAYTGMRRSEVAALRTADIDSKRRRIVIRDGKGGKHRVVFYASPLTALLDAQLAASTEYLFPGRNRKQGVSSRTINNIVSRAARQLGLENPNPRYREVNPHLLRHSFARNWKRSGAPLESLQRILGHSSIATTMDLYGTETVDDTAHNYSVTCDSLVSRSDRGGAFKES